MVQGFLDKIVVLSADESAEECTWCTEEVGGNENTLSRLDTMHAPCGFFLPFFWIWKAAAKTFSSTGDFWKGMHWRNCFLKYLSIGLNWVLRLYRRK